MRRAVVSFRTQLPSILAFVGSIWLLFFLQEPLALLEYALVPRELHGAVGVVLMPFLHGDLAHLAGNTPPLLVLLSLLSSSRARLWPTVALLLLGSGVILWLTGFSDHRYIGASMLVFALLAFLIVSGIRERRMIPILVAVLVAVLYGSMAIAGIFAFRHEVSEYAHLVGLATGGLLAGTVGTRRTVEISPRRRRRST